MPQLCHLIFLAAISATVTAATQSSLSPTDQTSNTIQRQRQRPNGLIDYTLRRINPEERHYGQEIENWRSGLIGNTIENPLFLPLGCATVLFFGAALIVFHQSKERRHRQLIAASFLAWYHNQLLDARERAEEEIEQFEKLRKAVDARQIAAAAERLSAVADQELMVEINSLRQKITLMENAEKALRQQNTELSRLLRQEQQKLQKIREDGGRTAAGKEAHDGK